jgi:hypothetical protein
VREAGGEKVKLALLQESPVYVYLSGTFKSS